MGEIYSVEFENVLIANADGDQDFFEITTGFQGLTIIHGVYLSQNLDVGESEEEILRVRIIVGAGEIVSGSGGGTATPRPMNPNSPAATFTCEINNTTPAAYFDPPFVHSDAFNTRAGWVWNPPNPMRIDNDKNGSTFVVRLMAGPGDDIRMSGTMYIEEVGKGSA